LRQQRGSAVNAGSKHDKALELEIMIVDEDGLLKLAGKKKES
jgi:NAD-dependent DNA ligase